MNKENKVFVAKRIDNPKNFWQMPQGGIDKDENPEEAVWREMMEEIGTNKAELIRMSNKWINYDIPKDTLATLPWGDKYKGQTQKWFAFKFLGKDSEINVGTDNPEFSEWKWSNHNLLVENIVPFKRKVYANMECL